MRYTIQLYTKSNHFFLIMSQESLISSFSCFLVQKVSHHGTLEIYPTKICFIYTGSEDNSKTNIDFSNITDIIVETRFAHAMNNLEIRVDDQSYLFTGLHEAQSVKDMINIMKQALEHPRVSYGFTNTGENTVQWKDLEDPILLYSCTVPANMAAVSSRILSKDFFIDLYGSVGNEDISINDWEEKDGYMERRIDYAKLVVLPVLGKNLIKVSETQLLFDLGNRKAIAVISNLGKTPFCECFDPQVQLFFDDKGDKVEFLVKFQMIWSSEPFVKSIIDNKTTTEIRAFYKDMGKQLLRELGGQTDEAEKREEEEEKKLEDDFAKTRKIYKLVIILLLVNLFFVVAHKYRKRGKKQHYIFFLWKMFMFFIFLLLLIFF